MSNRPVYKILLLGDSGVGKSCLLLQYVDGTYTDTFIGTIGVDYKLKEIEVGEEGVNLQIWDPVAESELQPVTSSFYRGAAGVFLLYDTSNEQSFQNIVDWHTAVKRFGSDAVVAVLVGTKADTADRKVDFDRAKEFADNEGLPFFETSAKENKNINEAFLCIAQNIQQVKQEEARNKQAGKPQRKKKKNCPIQ